MFNYRGYIEEKMLTLENRYGVFDSNPTEVDDIFKDVEILKTSSPGGTLSCESRV